MSRLYILNGPDKGQSFEMHEGDNFIGRSSENDFMVKDNTVSRKHLKIIKREKKKNRLRLRKNSAPAMIFGKRRPAHQGLRNLCWG